MAIASDAHRRYLGVFRSWLQRAKSSPRKRVVLLVAINVLVFSTCVVLAEIGFRLAWNPKYWLHSQCLLVGSGQTEAGKKWWPNTTYLVESSEFHVAFRTNASGYRLRPNAQSLSTTRPYRIAFVGDSFTEAMQVPYEATFCARIEQLLNERDPSRSWICDNYGISATDLFDYWHRIVHDVLPGARPDALVLCIFPGNDFQGILPDEGFDAADRPLRDYFQKPSWGKHGIVWVNLHSKFGFFVQRSVFSALSSQRPRPVRDSKPWWTSPDVAARVDDSLAVRRSRALLRAISEECRRCGTRLCVLVVGPVANYGSANGRSPLGQILANWRVDIPVIDVAVKARDRPDFSSLLFPYDGHPNEAGHTYLAQESILDLHALLADPSPPARRPQPRPGRH